MTPSSSRRNVLAIGVSAEEFDRFVPFLARKDFDVDRFPSGAGALEIIGHISIEVLMVRYPLPDMAMDSFLEAARHPESACRHSPLLLLTTADLLTEAQGFIGRGANRAIDLASADGQIQDMVSGLLQVAPRKAARFLARMEVKLGGTKDMILCQTENLSATGMLIRTDKRYEIGTQIHFEFSLPNDIRPLVGVAEVVRQTMHGRDSVGGVGVRFLSFIGDSQRRFEAYVNGL